MAAAGRPGARRRAERGPLSDLTPAGLARFRLTGVDDTWPALLTFLRDLPGTVRVILLDGDWTSSPTRATNPEAVEVRERLATGTTVSVAALSGPVTGAAADLALACTLRTADAGVSLDPPAWFGLPLLRERLGEGRTLGWLAAGRGLSCTELAAAGLAEPRPPEALVRDLLALPDGVLRETVAILRGADAGHAALRLAEDGPEAGTAPA